MKYQRIVADKAKGCYGQLGVKEQIDRWGGYTWAWAEPEHFPTFVELVSVY